MPWTHLIASEEQAEALYDDWQFSGIPVLLLVDRHGRIIATTEELRGEKLLKTLERFLESNKPGDGSDLFDFGPGPHLL